MVKKNVIGNCGEKSSKMCDICNTTIALAEPTTASKRIHLRCAAIEAAKGLIKLGMQLYPTDNRVELKSRLNKLLQEAMRMEEENSQQIAEALQQTSMWILGETIDISQFAPSQLRQ